MWEALWTIILRISIHASAKEATRASTPYCTIFIISIHASAKEATANNISFIIYFQFQSTPPRRRRLLLDLDLNGYDLISIHASAKEATANYGWSIAVINDFNPRLREGGDSSSSDKVSMIPDYFNPRLREGGDISLVVILLLCCIFQSTPPRRRRPLSRCCMLSKKLFQSTPPRRRRLRTISDNCIKLVFQSTPPRRRRLANPAIPVNNPLFQSTPPRRRRRFKGCYCHRNKFISIHASAKEATPLFYLLYIIPFYFNPRLREGGDEYFTKQGKYIWEFQSTPPRRRRLNSSEGVEVKNKFQSTPPRRRRL